MVLLAKGPKLACCHVIPTDSMAVLEHTAVAACTLILATALLKHDLDGHRRGCFQEA